MFQGKFMSLHTFIINIGPNGTSKKYMSQCLSCSYPCINWGRWQYLSIDRIFRTLFLFNLLFMSKFPILIWVCFLIEICNAQNFHFHCSKCHISKRQALKLTFCEFLHGDSTTWQSITCTTNAIECSFEAPTMQLMTAKHRYPQDIACITQWQIYCFPLEQ